MSNLTKKIHSKRKKSGKADVQTELPKEKARTVQAHHYGGDYICVDNCHLPARDALHTDAR